jgi:hypothetical protein
MSGAAYLYRVAANPVLAKGRRDDQISRRFCVYPSRRTVALQKVSAQLELNRPAPQTVLKDQ